MRDVSIDTSAREIRVCLELAGEPTPVENHVRNYSIEEAGSEE